MKDLDYFMALNYRYLVEHIEADGESYYKITVPRLPGVVAYADTFKDIENELNDAKKVWFETCLEEEIEIPEPIEQKYSGRITLRIPKTLHADLAMNAAIEGVSLNLYINYLLTERESQTKSFKLFSSTINKLELLIQKISLFFGRGSIDRKNVTPSESFIINGKSTNSHDDFNSVPDILNGKVGKTFEYRCSES